MNDFDRLTRTHSDKARPKTTYCAATLKRCQVTFLRLAAKSMQDVSALYVESLPLPSINGIVKTITVTSKKRLFKDRNLVSPSLITDHSQKYGHEIALILSRSFLCAKNQYQYDTWRSAWLWWPVYSNQQWWERLPFARTSSRLRCRRLWTASSINWPS